MCLLTLQFDSGYYISSLYRKVLDRLVLSQYIRTSLKLWNTVYEILKKLVFQTINKNQCLINCSRDLRAGGNGIVPSQSATSHVITLTSGAALNVVIGRITRIKVLASFLERIARFGGCTLAFDPSNKDHGDQ